MSARDTTKKQRILDYLAAGPARASDVAKALHDWRDLISVHLWQLRKQGHVIATRKAGVPHLLWALVNGADGAAGYTQAKGKGAVRIESILRELAAFPASTSQLADRLDMTLPTVSGYVRELLNAQRIRRVDAVRNDSGRVVPVWGIA